MLKKLYSKICNSTAKTSRIIVNHINRNKLKNKDFSLISSNCNGAFISHDLDLKFLSPTVNLFFFPGDFIKFVENLDFYLQQELQFIDNKNYNYPVGILKDIQIHFMHYKNKEDAKLQWEKRCKRINRKNIFIMMTDRDGCSEDMIRRFDELPYKNKVIFTNKEYKQFPSAFHISGFDNGPSVGHLFKFQNTFGKKYFDNFDYIKWFNNKL